MWQLIFSFLGGPVIQGLLNAYKAKLDLQNNQDQKALELLQKEVEADIAARAEATKILIAEQGHFATRMIRPLFAIPFIIFLFKVVVWDKVIGAAVGCAKAAAGTCALFTTDPLDPNMWGVFSVIVASYFGATAIERVSRIFRR